MLPHAKLIIMVRAIGHAVLTCLVFAGAGIVAANQPAATAVPADNDAAKVLTATVKADKAAFRTDEQLRFTVTFTNHSLEAIVLPVADSRGGKTAGIYTPSIRNVTTGEMWKVREVASQAPIRLTEEFLKAGATLDFTYGLTGAFARANGDTVPHLPAGKYELTLAIEVHGLTLAPAPAAFSVVEPAPLSKEEADVIVGQARKALADKLVKQAATEKGQTHPAAVDWSSLKADLFVATVEPHPQGNTVKFSGDVPGSDRVVTWSVHVTDEGVSLASLTQGFAIKSKQPSIVPAPAPQPR